LQAGAAGGLWVAWPCGLLQSALVVAGLANTPVAGAVVMFAFATSSALGLHLAPALWSWWSARGSSRPHAVRWEQLVVRLTGALLALGSLWALGQDVWGRVWAYCFG
jgi:sulfite exporter TauE/SafE